MACTLGRMFLQASWTPKIRRCLRMVVIATPVTLVTFVFLILVTADNTPRPHIVQPGSKDGTPRKGEVYRIFVERTQRCQNAEINRTLLLNQTCERIEKEMEEFFAPSKQVVNPYPYTYLRDAKNGKCEESTEIVILVHSTQLKKEYKTKREAIRLTWGKAAVENSWPNVDLGGRFKLVFVFGVSNDKSNENELQIESDTHGDILQGNFKDNYYNMTLKSLLGLKWVSEFCPNVKYMLKSDDDMFINMPYLLNILRGTDMTKSIMGPLNLGSKALRNGKWAVPMRQYPFVYYPPYEAGSAYIISGDLVKPLLEMSYYVPSIHIDDVYITGILGKILNVTHKRQAGFAFWTSKKSSSCDVFKNKVITVHRVTAQILHKMWSELESDKQCK